MLDMIDFSGLSQIDFKEARILACGCYRYERSRPAEESKDIYRGGAVNGWPGVETSN